MDTTTFGLIQAFTGGVFWFATLGLLIWLLIKAHSSAKLMAAIGLGLLLLPTPLGMLTAPLYSSAGMGGLAAMNVLNGAVHLAGVVLLVAAFLKIDAVASPVERRAAATRSAPESSVSGYPGQQPWQPPYPGGPGSVPGAQPPNR